MAAMTSTMLSRRSFLAMGAALPLAFKGAAAASGTIPVGLELYSVREALKKDPEGTVRTVAGMGYEAVEFYAPYFEWTETQAKQMRKLMDELGMRCYSTHNDQDYLTSKNILRTRDLNLILGSKYVVLAHWEPITKHGADGWRPLADELNSAAEQLEPAGLKVGYHNHQAEFTASGGQRPMDTIAKSTKPSVMLQLDVGTCLEAGADPVAWIRANPGRIRSIHCKDWSPAPDKGYKVLLGEGVADWKGIFGAAESIGGVEYYLVEQEGSRFSELETASRCLQAFRARHG
jgi:sugar phosphate isomerase/epimerase